MTVTMTPRVRLGWTSFGAADLTSRVTGFQTSLELRTNAMGTARATVTLRNDDGALTPGAGGTYSSTDWFANLLRIDWTVSDGTNNAYPGTFDGIITNFDLTDNGVQSSVTLTAVDTFSVGGRFRPSTVATFTSQLPTTYLSAAATTAAFAGAWPGASLGATVTFGNFGNTYNRNVRSETTLSGMTFADLVSNVVIPGVRGWAWPRDVESSLGVGHNAELVAGTKNSTYLTTYAFGDAPVSGTTLPYQVLKQGWTNDRMVNTVAITSLRTGATEQTVTNTTASGKYGSRTAVYKQAAADTNTQALTVATEMVTRYKDPRFIPLELQFTSSNITAYAANATYERVAQLLSYDCPLDLVEINWTPAGGSPLYARCIIVGRKIAFTYDRGTTVTLQLASWSDNTEWIIGTSMLGYDRLG